jgi:hypothetical protein
MKRIIFWDMTPCSLLSCNRSFAGTNRKHAECLPPARLLVLAEINSSTLKMDAICSSEMSVATQQTTRRYTRIPEADNLPSHRCENLRSYKMGLGGPGAESHRFGTTGPCASLSRTWEISRFGFLVMLPTIILTSY